MNIGIRLHDVAGNGLEAKLAQARAQGFTCVHIALSKVLPDFSMVQAPALLTERLAEDVRALLDKYALQPAVLGCYLNLATPDEAELAWTTAAYEAHLRFAAWLGALVVGTETGAPNAAYATSPECFTEEALALFTDRLRPVVRAAEAFGVPVAIEPVCRHIVSTPQRTRQVLDAIDSPMCRVILDPVNLLDVHNADQQAVIFDEALSLLGGNIDVVHWKDCRVENGVLLSMAAGLGDLQGDAVAAWLAARPSLPVTLEDTLPENAEAARKWLAQALRSAES